MDNDLDKNLEEQFQNLPKELREAISSADLPNKLQQITKNNQILLDQAENVQKETLLVLLGLEPLENYTENLQKNAELTKNQAIAIAHDINELVFKNVRETLRKINEDAEAAEAGATAEKEKLPAASALQPSREEILAGIENPENIKTKEEAVSISSISSNIPKPAEKSEIAPEKTEIKNDLLPEIYPETNISAESVLLPKQEPYHENISPVENIVQSKMSGPVIVPKETVVVEKTKLPDLPAGQAGKSKPSDSTDPYREPII